MTEREKYLLRQGIIQLLDNAYTAYKLVNCEPAEVVSKNLFFGDLWKEFYI